MNEARTINLGWGLSIGLLASVIQSAGLTLQRKSHIENAQSEKRLSDWQRPLWVLGLTIFISSNILGSLFQLGSLPIVILGPLGGVSLIWNAFFASVILKDHFSRYLLIGTLLIAGGAVLIAIFGAVPEPSHTLKELLLLYTRPAFLGWLGALAAFILLVLVPAHIADARLRQAISSGQGCSKSDTPDHRSSATPARHYRRWSEPVNVAALDLADLEENDVTSAQSPSTSTSEQQDQSSEFMIGIAYGSISGTLSGLCLLLAKTGVEVLANSLFGKENEFVHWQAWMIVVVLFASALLQLWYLNKSLTLLGPTLICPLAFCFYNLSSILNGLGMFRISVICTLINIVFYDQWRFMTPLKIGLVVLGIFVLLAGVWIVSLKSSSNDNEGKRGAAVDENAPLLLAEEPEDYGTDTEFATDAHRRKGIEALKELLLQAPSGLSIGLAASSPGFALKPANRILARHERRNLRASTISLPSGDLASKFTSSPPIRQAFFPRHRRCRSGSGSPELYRSLANDVYVGEEPSAIRPSPAAPPTSPVETKSRWKFFRRPWS